MLSLIGRYSGEGGRGGLQAEWAFPVSGSLKGYVQLTSGYGASLVDYNHSQTTLGVGLFLLPWQSQAPRRSVSSGRSTAIPAGPKRY